MNNGALAIQERLNASQAQALPSGPGFLDVESTRAAKEVEAAVAVAKRFPRDTTSAFRRIIEACKRRNLAEQAEYAFPRGKETVTGPSIRLAEVLAQNWGNIQYGIRELSQNDGESVVEVFCWDVETNVRATRTFTQPHARYTKSDGLKELKDPRDIYEIVANNGARRLRACILEIIPGDIVEAALGQCDETLKKNEEPIIDRIRNMVTAFSELGVSQEMLEKRLNHKVDTCNETELLNLKRIFRSLKDGVAKREEFFEVGAAPVDNSKAQGITDKLKAAAQSDQDQESAPGDFGKYQAGPPPRATQEKPRTKAELVILIQAEGKKLGMDMTAIDARCQNEFKKPAGKMDKDDCVKLLQMLQDDVAKAGVK